jgi:hypothetical protein
MDIDMATNGGLSTSGTGKNEELLTTLKAVLESGSNLNISQAALATPNGCCCYSKDDESELSELLAKVFRDVIDISAKSKWAEDFIPRQNIDRAEAVVKSFSKQDFKEWEDALQQGVKPGDWKGIFLHRTHSPSDVMTRPDDHIDRPLRE